jgi:hypothetical protein
LFEIFTDFSVIVKPLGGFSIILSSVAEPEAGAARSRIILLAAAGASSKRIKFRILH